jgi:hypothetical protein
VCWFWIKCQLLISVNPRGSYEASHFKRKESYSFLKPVYAAWDVGCPTIAVLQCPGNEWCSNIKIRRGTSWCSLFCSDNALFHRINTQQDIHSGGTKLPNQQNLKKGYKAIVHAQDMVIKLWSEKHCSYVLSYMRQDERIRWILFLSLCFYAWTFVKTIKKGRICFSAATEAYHCKMYKEFQAIS